MNKNTSKLKQIAIILLFIIIIAIGAYFNNLEEYIKENNINKQQIEKSEDKEYKLGNAIWKCLNVDNSNPSFEHSKTNLCNYICGK